MSNETAIISLKEKIDDLNQQAWEVRVTDLPKSFELSQESVKLARSINYTKGLAKGLQSLGFSYVRYSKNDEAAPLLKEALSLFQSLNDLKGQAVIYEYLGIIERNWGNLGASLDLLLKANDLVLQIDSQEIEITCSYQLGVTYKHLGDHENALDYLYKTLSLAKKMNFTLMEAYATNIIGSIYFDNGNYRQALDCYQQGLPIRQQSHDKWGEAGSLDNIGFTYLKLNDLDKAIEYCKQSLAICQATGDKKGEANALLHLGEIYEQAGDIKQAAGFSNESLEIRRTRGDKRGETEVLLFLADLYKNRNDVEDHQIFEWLSGALKIADEIKAQDLLSKAYYNLHEYYQQKGNFKESLVQLEAHFQIEKELHKNSINQKIASLEISHKAEVVSQRNKELTELNEKIEKANEELKIERSLERVRTAAMAMKEPADMLEICKIISDQLEILDVKKIRNVQTAIFYEEKGVYMNYEYYAKHDKQLITEVDYNNHQVAEKFANQMLKGPNQFWTHGFKGDEVKDWLNYQRSTNVFIDTFLEKADSLNYYWYSLGAVALGMSTYVPLNENEIELFKRFRNVFELAYRRYLDIEKAQAQAREAKIEAALERIRARAMAMHKSDELLDIIIVVSEQLQQLNIKFGNVSFGVNNQNYDLQLWMAVKGYPQAYHIQWTFLDNRGVTRLKEAQQHPEKVYTDVLTQAENNEWLQHIFNCNPALEIFSDEARNKVLNSPGYARSIAVMKDIFLVMGNYAAIPYTEDENTILKRFANVFEQAYKRFLDLKQAEAQTREAQIELGLERVRARAMAMQNSDELNDLVAILFEELTKLDLILARCIIWIFDNDELSARLWMANSEDKKSAESYYIKRLQHSYYEAVIKGWKERDPKWVYDLKGDEKKTIDRLLLNETELSRLPDAVKNGILNSEHTIISGSFNNFGLIEASGPVELSAEQMDIVNRFAKVFDLTYTRFNDLKQAEAQAREAQIEVALERIRARAMAMHSSNELMDVANILREQMGLLDQPDLETSVVNLFEEDSELIFSWNASRVPGSSEKIISSITSFLKNSSELTREMMSLYHSKEKEYTLEAAGLKLMEFLKVLIEANPRVADYIGNNPPEKVFYHFTTFTGGNLLTVSYQPPSEETKSLQRRAASVFDMAYRRYLDLKKAEAQAREAKIEAALERVRAKAMAMHKSEDLNPAVATVFEELDKLNIGILRCGIAIMDKEKPRGDVWITVKSEQSNTIQVSGDESLDYHPLLRGAYDGWLKQEDFSYVLQGEDLISYYRDVASIKYQLPVSTSFDTEKKDQQQYYYNAVFHDGSLFAFMETAITDEAQTVIKRFANVFNLTYKRFLDLQKAEAQTREAKIEAALERVRARALAMQEPEELKDVALVLRSEMGELGIEELETCSIYINDEATNKTECWYALKDSREEGKKLVSDHFPLNLNDTWVGREMKNFYRSEAKQVSIVMQGADRKEWINYCEERSVPFRGYYGELIPDRTYHLYKFSHGAIGAAAAGDISAESWKLLSRAASVFSLAYSRFKDLTQARNDLIQLKEEKKRAEDALTELQATQKQLIQAEKMASLGELTAGIAHEIQNPLNFVNNFSDVSNELLEEMKTELEKGNAEGAKEIAIDVKENLEKILHHGKRADAIVKGMLQHSRTSSGQKELTDINTLAEEYLRLAYHGLRAKDKFFNAKFETDLDRSISKINIVPQEIGRVILNMINNSFYAVTEKKKLLGNGYEPTVTVSTKTVKPPKGGLGVIEIRVMDNGNGIPKKDLDKIFQPFFTTKPTGQGTGLGLSLSYDIVTKGHDGEIKVETKEGEGSAFIISLPMK